MLQVNELSGFGGGASGGSLIDIIRGVGLTSGLKVCLDAGDAASYTSGQSWLDRSGGGYDFFIGTTGSSTASDPTFNGTAGRLSNAEYFSFDGGDNFTYDSAIETWMNNLHKDSAVFTMLAWVYHVTGTGGGLFGDNAGATTNVGIGWRATTGNVLRVNGGNGSGSIINQSTTATLTGSAWNFVAIAMTEASSGLLMQINGTQETFSAAYSSPTASDASITPQIAGMGSSQVLQASGARMGAFAIWEGVALTAAQLNTMREATRGRFGV